EGATGPGRGDAARHAPQAARHVRRRRGRPAGRLTEPGPPDRRRGTRRRRRDGPLRPRRAGDLPLGAAGGDHPRAVGPDRRPRLIALSTASVYPESTADGFELASRLTYDAVEVMVGIDPISQEVDAVRHLSEHYGMPV